MKAMIWKRSLCVMLATVLSVQAISCGTLMYPERVGQSHSGNLDWTVVGLDAIGLIFFFVPGAIAFAVDFYNGTIFLPGHGYGSLDQTDAEVRGQSPASDNMIKIHIDPEKLTKAEIERVLFEKTGRKITLNDRQMRALKLNSIQQFEPQRSQLKQHLDQYPATVVRFAH